MGRMVLLAMVLIILVASVGFLALGAFPPEPHPVGVHKSVPTDRIGRSF